MSTHTSDPSHDDSTPAPSEPSFDQVVWGQTRHDSPTQAKSITSHDMVEIPIRNDMQLFATIARLIEHETSFVVCEGPSLWVPIEVSTEISSWMAAESSVIESIKAMGTANPRHRELLSESPPIIFDPLPSDLAPSNRPSVDALTLECTKPGCGFSTQNLSEAAVHVLRVATPTPYTNPILAGRGNDHEVVIR